MPEWAGSMGGAPPVEAGGRLLTRSCGWPSLLTSLTGTMAAPTPWVKRIRWLTQPFAFGFCSRASSRADSMTWRGTPLIDVAVGVDVGEVVVLAHGLELVERRPQRAADPTAGRW